MCASRHDPYAAIALEAGAPGIATICFRDSGDIGIGILADQGDEIAVDDLDLDAFSDALNQQPLQGGRIAELITAEQSRAEQRQPPMRSSPHHGPQTCLATCVEHRRANAPPPWVSQVVHSLSQASSTRSRDWRS